MINVTMRVTGVPGQRRRIESLMGRLKDSHGGLLLATNRVADAWRSSFDASGSMVGWAPLSEVTNIIRESQGFPREVPILFRSGALRRVAVDKFQDATRSGSWQKSDSYSRHTTSGRLSIKDGVASLSVSGWKVTNQTGFSYRRGNRTVRVPGRPFWFVNDTVRYQARVGVAEWVKKEVARA